MLKHINILFSDKNIQETDWKKIFKIVLKHLNYLKSFEWFLWDIIFICIIIIAL